MSDHSKTTSVGPAQWVGGQRRKLSRRNRSISGSTTGSAAGLPRSNTMPSLHPASFLTGLDVAGLVSADSVKDRRSKNGVEQSQRSSVKRSKSREEMMPSRLPSIAIKSDVSPPPLPGTQFSSPPRLTRTNTRKKQSLFGYKKPTPLERRPPPIITSPLPVDTPSKAAKFFGVDTGPATAGSSEYTRYLEDSLADDVQDEVSPRLAVQQKDFMFMMTKSNKSSENLALFDNNVVDSGQPLQTNTGKAAASTKGLRILIPEPAGSRLSPVGQNAALTTRFSFQAGDDNSNIGLGSSNSQVPQIQASVAARPVPPVPKRDRMRRRALKTFKRMSPITEASTESLRPAYRNDEVIAELGVISEHESDKAPHDTSVLPRSYSEMTLEPAFELEKDDLSPTDYFYDENASMSDEDGDEDEDKYGVHPGFKVDLKRMCRQNNDLLYLRSPLQTVEDAYLDATEDEMRLEARRMALAKLKAEKRNMDVEVEVLRREQERLRLQFSNFKTSAVDDQQPVPNLNASSAGEIRVSPDSDIGSDEEPTVHKAELASFTRVIPGAVKQVQIPRNKKIPISHTGSSISARTNNGRRSMENIPPVSPLITHHHHEDLDSVSEPKESMPSEESRILVRNWVSTYNSTEQQPISTRVDPDVLADQETPPAPFPKSDEAMCTPPIAAKTQPDPFKLPLSLQKYQCINNGHIFHPIDLRKVPDETVVNSLEVRPYLQTYTGIQQHVKIPVLCETCEKDCDENVWECEIAVCRMVVCRSCAVNMEMECRERAVNGWKHH